MQTRGKVIFISMPSKGSVSDNSKETGMLKDMVYRTVAKLHEMHPDYTFIVPMIQDYTLLNICPRARSGNFRLNEEEQNADSIRSQI